MDDTVGNHFDCEAFGIANRLVPSLAVTHDARKLESFGDPAAIFLAVEVYRQIHFFIILPKIGGLRSRPPSAYNQQRTACPT